MADYPKYAFSENELDTLHALRRATAEISGSTVMRSSAHAQATPSRIGGGVVGHDEERFRSFMIALRKTCSEKGKASFFRSATIIARHCEHRREDIDSLKSAYHEVLRGNQVVLNGMGHEEIFKAWLYGSVFHDDNADLRHKWTELTQTPWGEIAKLVVQATAVELAQNTLLWI